MLCFCLSLPSSLNKRPTDIRWATVEMLKKRNKQKTHCLLKLKLNKTAVALLHCILFLRYYIWLSLIQSLKKKQQCKQQRLR